jgi:hypothetical protein
MDFPFYAWIVCRSIQRPIAVGTTDQPGENGCDGSGEEGAQSPVLEGSERTREGVDGELSGNATQRGGLSRNSISPMRGTAEGIRTRLQ